MRRWRFSRTALGLALLSVCVLGGVASAGAAPKKAKVQTEEAAVSAAIVALERAALDRWGKGDPSGFLDITADDVVYFDPMVEKRLDGRVALAQYYEGVRGKVKTDRYELMNPRVQRTGKMAVLTYNLVAWAGGQEHRWNCTEVYRHDPPGWRIIQTHWSFTQAVK